MSTNMAMALPLSPPPSRSSSQRSQHAAIAIMPPSSSFSPSSTLKMSTLPSIQQQQQSLQPQRPTIVLPSENHPSFLADPSASVYTGTATTASSDLRSFFSPCSSDDESSEDEENRAIRGSPRTTRKAGHYSRLWASMKAPSPAPRVPLPAVSVPNTAQGNNDKRVNSGINSTSTGRKTIRRKSTFGPARRLSLADMFEADGNQKQQPPAREQATGFEKNNGFWSLPPPPMQPVFAPSVPSSVATPFFPTYPQQPTATSESKDLHTQLTYLSHLLSMQTALYTTMSSPPPAINPEMAVMHQDLAKTHLQQLHSLSEAYASTLSLLTRESTVPQIAIPKTRRKSKVDTPRETPKEVNAGVAEAKRERDRIMVQTQKAHLRRASRGRIENLHRELEEAERKVRIAEGVEVAAKEEAQPQAEIEEVDGGLSASRSGSCWSDDEDDDEEPEEDDEEEWKTQEKGFPPLPSLTTDEEIYLATLSQQSSPQFPPPSIKETVLEIHSRQTEENFGNESPCYSPRSRGRILGPEDYPLPPSPPLQTPEVLVVDGVEMRMI